MSSIERIAWEGAMILGMSTSTFTTLHVIISLIGIASGLVVLFGMFGSNRLSGWTAIFLLTTILTSVTGFFFPVVGLDPARIVGFISLIVLVAALLGLYVFGLQGAWRWIYVVGALIGLYLNCFVAVVQSFQKLSFLQPLAPTQSEPPFQIAQGVVLVLFIIFGFLAIRKFHPERTTVS
jgi:hypothetical protein